MVLQIWYGRGRKGGGGLNEDKPQGKQERETLFVTLTSYFADEDIKPKGLQVNHLSQKVGFRVGFGILSLRK